MNAFTLLGALALISLIMLGIAWLHHMWAHRNARPPATLEQNIDRLNAVATGLQILLCMIIGGLVGTIYYLGYMFEATGGWR